MRELLGDASGGGSNGKRGMDDDDDIMTIEVTESFLCPLTTKTLVEPVGAGCCSSHYEKKAILAVLKKNPQGYPCPCIGCNHVLKKEHLKDAPDVARKIARETKRKRLEQATQGGPADDGFTQID